MHTFRKVIGLLILTLAFTGSVVEGHQEDGELGGRSLEELFELGSREDFDGSLRQAAPVEELTRRPRGAVLSMTVGRLGNSAYFGTYRDAFLVRVLRAVRPDGLAGLLEEAYPRLDAGGRYEVLVYGVDERVEALSALYEDVLAADAGPSGVREQILATKFAFEFPSSDWLVPLERLAERLSREKMQYIDLTGYGEDGEPGRFVPEPVSLVHATIRRVRAAERHRRMTEEERAILESLRRNILDPPRKAIHIDDLVLKEALSELQQTYQVAPDPRSLRSLGDDILDRRVSMHFDAASAAEGFASFCNQTGFSTTAGYHVGAGAIGDPALARNHAFAMGGLILEAEPDEWDVGEVTIVATVTSPEAWYWVEHQAFRLVEGRLADGASIPPDADFSARLGILSLPVSEHDWNGAGRRIESLEADLEIPIPTAVRRVRLTPTVGKTVRETVDDIFFIDVTTDGNDDDGFGVEARFGVDLGDFSRDVTTINFGDVDLIDETGQSLERYLYLSGVDFNFHKKGYRRTPRPLEVVWTFVPLAEILRVRARWDDVRMLTGSP